jgi:hypothetical protein
MHMGREQYLLCDSEYVLKNAAVYNQSINCPICLVLFFTGKNLEIIDIVQSLSHFRLTITYLYSFHKICCLTPLSTQVSFRPKTMLVEVFVSLSTAAPAFLACGTILLLWRLWVFTVRPWIWPSEPRYMPYWVPCKLTLLITVRKNVC